MLTEAKISRPRPRPRPGSRGRGRDRGQSFEVKAEAEAEANFLRSRPRPRPKKKLWIKSYQMIVDHIQANLYHYDQNDTVYYSFSYASSIIVWCPVVGKVNCKQIGPSITSWLLVLLLQTEARPRPNVWGQGRGRGQSFEAETEAEAKILASRPLWPRGLNISCSLNLLWVSLSLNGIRSID